MGAASAASSSAEAWPKRGRDVVEAPSRGPTGRQDTLSQGRRLEVFEAGDHVLTLASRMERNRVNIPSWKAGHSRVLILHMDNEARCPTLQHLSDSEIIQLFDNAGPVERILWSSEGTPWRSTARLFGVRDTPPRTKTERWNI